MKKREIIILIIAFALICVALYYLGGIEALAYLLIGLIFIVISSVYNSNGTSNYKSRIKVPSHKKIINKSFDLLHSRFKDRRFIYKTGFILPPDIELRLNSGIYSEKDIEQLVKMMMLKVGVPTGMMKVKTEWVFTPVNSTSSGTFQKHSPIKETITIKCKKSYNKDVILSILAHEVAHSFLDMHKISFPEIIDNEILTDTCAVYLGFGDIMEKGYEQFSTGNNSYEKVGYISAEEVIFIMKKMDAQRSSDVKNNSKNQDITIDNENIDSTQEMLQAIEEIEKYHKSNLKLYAFLQKNISKVDILPSDEEIINIIFKEIEQVETQINELKNKQFTSNLNKENIEILLSKLMQWNKVLRKYSII